MRTFRHWTPRYLRDSIAWRIYQRRHPDEPWLTPAANALLATLILPTDHGIEWGSGRSTCWLAKRMAHLTSVEDDPAWHQRIAEQIRRDGLTNVTYLLKVTGEDLHDPSSAYVGVYKLFADESLGFALVDGQARGACALAVIDKLAPGGLLVIDNIQWFLDRPLHAAQPHFERGKRTADWDRLEQRLSGWRMMWTTSGVSDTAIWIKPPGTRATSVAG